MRLNPYSNGLLSELNKKVYGKNKKSLNPYSNGLLSEKEKKTNLLDEYVLILILMDYSLSNMKNKAMLELRCLNPYSNGLLSEF